MSVGLPSDEVAEDYKNSLEDLTLNSRYEINNLTVIAKENTAHAMAISRVLENHIKNTPAERKLPALYVLDSVVKNVGTPYTLFLGKNLYTIFMNAYSLVKTDVRRKLDEMLKTWKEPVPGSRDQRPVFPIEHTKPIETALIKARTAAVQQQRQQNTRTQQELLARHRPMATAMSTAMSQWRGTPTPPQVNGQYYPPPHQSFPQHGAPNSQYQTRPPYSPPAQYPPPQAYPQTYQTPTQTPNQYIQPLPAQQFDPLNRDIAELVKTTKEQLAANILDESVKGRLQALLALQNVMSQQQLSPPELQAVRDQITLLSSRSAQTPVPTSYLLPAQSLQSQQHPPAYQLPAPQATSSQASLDSKHLADIIARAQRAPATPPAPQASPLHPQASAPSAPVDLLATLRAQGLFKTGPATPLNGSIEYQPPPATHPPHTHSSNLTRPALSNDVELTSASLKRPRPQLISTLYEARPNQCSTCGRRFLATEEGKEKKARHLDWHFRTNQRLVDSAKRGQSRSWYVDELEWIKSRDNPEDVLLSEASSAATKAALAASLAAADPKNKHIPVPSDPALASQPCPICQEKFETTWNDEAQDFVWRDAIQIGSRVYHASCHSEVKKDGENTPGRTKTPDSVLGKRKAGVAGVLDMTSNSAKAIKA